MKTLLIYAFVIISFLSTESFAQVGDFKQDTSQKIEITSNTLKLMPNENLAIFKDNVIAIQGDLKITSDVMDVDYHDSEGKKRTGHSISLINTKGNTVLTVPGKEGTSEEGFFDVDRGIIVMRNNVVLTQEHSVIRGEKLIHDTITSKSYVFSKKQIKTGKPEEETIQDIIKNRENILEAAKKEENKVNTK